MSDFEFTLKRLSEASDYMRRRIEQSMRLDLERLEREAEAFLKMGFLPQELTIAEYGHDGDRMVIPAPREPPTA